MHRRPKDTIAAVLARIHADLERDGLVPAGTVASYTLTSPKQVDHGDLATNMALLLAKPARKNPRELAQEIIGRLADGDGVVQRAEIAGPGFINFFIAPAAHCEVLGAVLCEREAFLRTAPQPQRILVEFVSANPTGPLHVGHGRGAVTGDALVRMLRRIGHHVESEYYVNDAGNQVEVLASSILVRYQELCGEAPAHPEDFYPGEYVTELARTIHGERGAALLSDRAAALPYLRDRAIAIIVQWIKDDLASFDIHFDHWTSERALAEACDIPGLMGRIRAAGYLYEQDGKQWFRTTAFGDEKDRVVLREDGRPTYFASDITYHHVKMERGYDQLINVWGADHVGYIPRVKAGLAACGHDPQRLRVVLVQMVNLLRDGEPVRMGKRLGNFVCLSELLEETGRDASRFFFVLRSSDAQLDFDIALAQKKSLDNPVYYVQYGHARLCAIVRAAQTQGIPLPAWDPVTVEALRLPEELALIKMMAQAPDVLAEAAAALEPHRIVYFLRDLIGQFHSYYTHYKHTEKVISANLATTAARLLLCLALRDLLADLLAVLGISAPERMQLDEAAGEDEGSA